MELLQRQKEIMKLQSELIKEKKLLDSKVDSNILQKLCLEKRKLILLPTVEVPVTCTSETSSPENSVPKLPYIIKKARRSLLAEFGKGTSKVVKQLLQGEVPDDDLLQALGKVDETK